MDYSYPFLLDIVVKASKDDYRLRRLTFSKKMIQQLQRGRRSVIYPDDYFDNDLPSDGELLYIAEPFHRRYGLDGKGMIVPSSILYSDKAEKILQQVQQLPERETLTANAMLEHEARYFVRVKKVKYRIIKSLHFKDLIYDSFGDAKRNDRVVMITFELLSDKEVQDWYNYQRAEEWFESIF